MKHDNLDKILKGVLLIMDDSDVHMGNVSTYYY